MLAQLFGAFDGIVIGEREEIHAAALQASINFVGDRYNFRGKTSGQRGLYEARRSTSGHAGRISRFQK